MPPAGSLGIRPLASHNCRAGSEQADCVAAVCLRDFTAGILCWPRYVRRDCLRAPLMHMKRTTIAMIALAASVVPVLAAGGLSGMGANLFGNYFKFGNKPNISEPKVHTITVGPMHMTLQHTRLQDIKKVFGGTIQSQGSDRSLARWLCYQTDGKKG